MAINDHDDPAIQKSFLISYPQDFTVRSLFGRATRGMRGCDLDLERSTSKMVYIKDYWRSEGGEKEGEIYWSLEEKNIPSIPRFYCGNDVCYKVRRNNVVQERRDNPVEVTGTMFLRKHARQYLNPRHTLLYITGWCWIELVGS